MRIFIALIGFIFPLMVFADTPSIHGMLLFGQNSNYLSHLPMFHKPHDYQVILKVDLEPIEEDDKTIQLYNNKKEEGFKLFTIVPESMDLTKIISGQRNSFQADLFLGHFERGGEKLGSIFVKIEQNIYSKKLDKTEQASSKFISFGKNGEYFAAHLIFGQPTYDAVFSISAVSKIFYPPCRTRVCQEPVYSQVEDNELPLIIEGKPAYKKTAPETGDSLTYKAFLHTEIKQSLYVEYEELSH